MNCFQNNFRKLRIFRSKGWEDHFLRNFPFHHFFIRFFAQTLHWTWCTSNFYCRCFLWSSLYYIFCYIVWRVLHWTSNNIFAFLFQSIFWPHCIVFLPIFLYTNACEEQKGFWTKEKPSSLLYQNSFQHHIDVSLYLSARKKKLVINNTWRKEKNRIFTCLRSSLIDKHAILQKI